MNLSSEFGLERNNMLWQNYWYCKLGTDHQKIQIFQLSFSDQLKERNSALEICKEEYFLCLFYLIKIGLFFYINFIPYRLKRKVTNMDNY